MDYKLAIFELDVCASLYESDYKKSITEQLIRKKTIPKGVIRVSF